MVKLKVTVYTKLPRMNIIKDNVLHSLEDKVYSAAPTRYIHRLINSVQEELRQTGDRVWIVETETRQTINISQIVPISLKVARGLIKLGFGPGDVLQTGYSNHPCFYWPVFGAWLVGGVVSVPDPNLPPRQVKLQIEEAATKVIVCSLEFVDKYSQIIQDLKEDGRQAPLLYVLDALEDEPLPPEAQSFQHFLLNIEDDSVCMPALPAYDPTKPFTILWSSGSTGDPKGIIHNEPRSPHELGLFENVSKIMLTNAQYHSGGFIFYLTLGIFEKVTCFMSSENRFSAEHCLDLIEEFEPQHLFVGVSQFIELASTEYRPQRLHGLQSVTPCGGAISPGIINKVLNILGSCVKIIELYGTTEVGMVSKYEDHNPTLGLLGSLRPGVEVCIRDINTHSRLGPRQEGMIMAKTPNMMLGFLNRHDETIKFFDSEGFGYTGDIGHFDEAGNLFYCYRMNDAIKVNNCWIGPEEVEDVLESAGDIKEAVAWGEYDPNTGNDRIEVGVVFRDNVQPWSEGRIRSMAHEHLRPTKFITGNIYNLKTIPHTQHHKKVRRVMKKFVENNVNLLE